MRESRIGCTEQRFFGRFKVNEDTGCWNWTGPPTDNGYGMISGAIGGKRYVPKGGRMLAHRVSWIIHNGEIPPGDGAHGTVVMHTCDNRLCVNPKHLRLGTQADNVYDMIDKGRKVSGTPSGVKHWNAAIKNQADVDMICATEGRTKELAERFGVDVCTIKRLRRRGGRVHPDAEKFKNKPISKEAVQHIRSTKPGTRGLGKLYGLSKTAIANIRKGLTHPD
jgi:hypothetical protein